MERLNLSVRVSDIARLDALCSALGSTRSGLVRRLIELASFGIVGVALDSLREDGQQLGSDGAEREAGPCANDSQ